MSWEEEAQVLAGESAIYLDHKDAALDNDRFKLDGSIYDWDEEAQQNP